MKIVRLNEETHKELAIIKAYNNKKTLNETIQLLLKQYKEKNDKNK